MSINTPKKRVIVAMSGGVDSSVSALLLKQQGYDVQGLFMKNWEEDDTESYCAAEQDVTDARAVCEKLGITLHTVNFAAEYWDNVFTYFLAEYQNGRTPNPDVLCNREIKFKACLEYAMHLGADYFATGHYAQHVRDNQQDFLVKGLDDNKDQTYFLCALNQQQLKNTLFPIGHLPKSQVRQIAFEAGLVNHAKKDSTGICFIGERRFKDFLSRYLPAQRGNIETREGKIMGQHDGLMYYTLGQRQGLGIGGSKESNGQPWYVVAKNLDRNVLVVAPGHDHPQLYSRALICHQVNWIDSKTQTVDLTCFAKTRYRQPEQPCKVKATANGSYYVEFLRAQWAVTPGQFIVFYQDNICLGGGVIAESLP